MSEGLQNERQRAATPDFLSRVIDGAFERGNALEPRRPSVFEPPTADFGAPVAWSVEHADRGEERAVLASVARQSEREDNRLTVPSAVTTPGNSVPPEIDHPQTHRIRNPSATVSALMPAYEPELAPIAAVRSPVPSTEKASERNVLTAKPLPVAKNVHLEASVEQQHKPQHPVPDSPIGVLLAQKAMPTMVTPRESTLVVPAPEKREASRQSIQRPEHLQGQIVSPKQELGRIIIEPPTLRHRPERQPLHADVVSPSSEPVVNVTIGRVEIRAVQAPSATPRQRAEPHGAKPMSLDDYLKQRGAGR
jgi:hypothetical protein